MSMDINKIKAVGIDTDELMERVLNNEIIAHQVLAAFARETSVSELGNALDAGNIADACRAAHKLKGSSSTIAAHNLADAAQTELDALHAEELNQARVIYQSIVSSYEDIKQAIKQ